MKKNTRQYSGMGASSLLMVFVVLCLTIFSIVSLRASIIDLKMSQKSLEFAENYYKADSLTEKQIIKLNEILILTSRESNGSQNSFNSLFYPQISNLEHVNSAGNGVVTLKVDVSENQSIITVININSVGSAQSYQIISRKLVTEFDWDDIY